MTEFTLIPEADEDEQKYEPPPYGTPGWVLVHILQVYPPEERLFKWNRFEIDECAVDTEHSTFWLQEGIGANYFVNHYIDEDLGEGWWMIEGVVGTYYRGEWGYTDDDEEWEYQSVRPATPEEIAPYKND